MRIIKLAKGQKLKTYRKALKRIRKGKAKKGDQTLINSFGNLDIQTVEEQEDMLNELWSKSTDKEGNFGLEHGTTMVVSYRSCLKTL